MEEFIKPVCDRCGSDENVGVNLDYDCADCRECAIKFITEQNESPECGETSIMVNKPKYIKWREDYGGYHTQNAYDIHEWKSFDCEHLDKDFLDTDLWK
jgi:hypothetical protein